ncbi:MAG: polyphenol oxidase family protein [Acidimicrobiales bacterium]
MRAGADPAAPLGPTFAAALPGGSIVRAGTTTRAAGDLQIDGPADVLAARRRAVVDRPWAWLRQAHGADVVTVTDGDVADGLARVVGAEADALVTTSAAVVLAVQTADCAPLALWSPEGVVAAVHAGWRGIEAGVVGAAVDAMRAAGASSVAGWLGPCIHAECYEFGADDLARLVDGLGPTVAGRTAAGRPALDLPAAVVVAATRAGVERLDGDGGCTACDADRWWSHRARGDAARQATVVWREVPG